MFLVLMLVYMYNNNMNMKRGVWIKRGGIREWRSRGILGIFGGDFGGIASFYVVLSLFIMFLVSMPVYMYNNNMNMKRGVLIKRGGIREWRSREEERGGKEFYKIMFKIKKKKEK